MKAYSVDFREKIISALEEDDSSVRKVAQRFSVSKNFVQKGSNRKKLVSYRAIAEVREDFEV